MLFTVFDFGDCSTDICLFVLCWFVLIVCYVFLLYIKDTEVGSMMQEVGNTEMSNSSYFLPPTSYFLPAAAAFSAFTLFT